MNDDQLNRLFAAARQAPPDTARAQYGFETRLLARLRDERRQAVPWLVWAWRLTPVFAAIVLALGVWNFTVAGQDVSTDEVATVALLTGGE